MAGTGDAWLEDQQSHLPRALASLKTSQIKDWFLWKEDKH